MRGTSKGYVRPIENSMETKEYLLKKHLTDSAKYYSNGAQYSNYENVNVVRKPGRRPGSASSTRDVRTFRTVATGNESSAPRRVIVRRLYDAPRDYDDGYVARRVVRVVDRDEPKKVLVVRRPVESEEREGRVVRRIITRSRPSSYNGRDRTEPIIIRRERPSSYHAGMADEYEPVQEEETSTTEEEREKVVREYRLQNNETVKQLEGDRWVDEYEVPDKEVRNVGVQMTTNYVVPKPPEKEIRTIGTQTKAKKEKPPPPREPTPPLPRIPTPPPPKPKKKKVKPPPPKIQTPEPEPVIIKQKPKLPPPLPVIYRVSKNYVF
jgi:hypothetical protein